MYVLRESTKIQLAILQQTLYFPSVRITSILLLLLLLLLLAEADYGNSANCPQKPYYAVVTLGQGSKTVVLGDIAVTPP